jgi:outer membrane protein
MLRLPAPTVALAVAGILALPGLLRAAEADAKSEFKLGVVDTRRAIMSCKAGQDAQKGLDNMMNKKKDQFSPKEEELKKLEQDYDTQKTLLAQDALEERRIEIARIKSQLDRSVEEAREEMALAERKAFQPLLTKVEGLLKDIGKEKGLVMILEKSSPGVLYYNDNLDITDILIERLNKS